MSSFNQTQFSGDKKEIKCLSCGTTSGGFAYEIADKDGYKSYRCSNFHEWKMNPNTMERK